MKKMTYELMRDKEKSDKFMIMLSELDLDEKGEIINFEELKDYLKKEIIDFVIRIYSDRTCIYITSNTSDVYKIVVLLEREGYKWDKEDLLDIFSNTGNKKEAAWAMLLNR